MTAAPSTARPRRDVGIRAFERSLPMALLRAREAVMRRFRPILARHDLTEQQWRVLRALADVDDPVSVGGLAERTFLLGPSLSRMLVTLERRGLVGRSSGSRDARRAEITITPAGLDLVASIAPHSEQAYDRIADAFDDGELDQLEALLARLSAL